MQRVPSFAPVYLDHSDLFVHLLSDHTSGLYRDSLSATDLAAAYETLITDYENAARHTTTIPGDIIELALAFISGDWRSMGRQIERALKDPGCVQGNWTPIIADAFGYSERLVEHSLRVIECDPRRSLSWFILSWSYLRMADIEQAMEYARKGVDIAPGGWLDSALARALVADGQHEAARNIIDKRFEDRYLTLVIKARVAAQEGDRSLYDQIAAEYAAQNDIGDLYNALLIAAWGGERDEANRLAGEIDADSFGYVPLVMITEWCACGAPFDASATPNFAARLNNSDLVWPPTPAMDYPLKQW